MLIAFEGTDASGKSRISKLTYERLRSHVPAVRYCPKRPDLGEPSLDRQLRRHANATWHPEILGRPENPFSDEYWALLVAAWYVGLEQHVFQPAASAGYHVVMEKWFLGMVSKLIVQGGDRKWLLSLFRSVRQPNLIVLLDIEPEVARARRESFWPTETGAWGGASWSGQFHRYQSAIRKELKRATRQTDRLIVEHRSGRTPEAMADRVAEEVLRRLRRSAVRGPMSQASPASFRSERSGA